MSRAVEAEADARRKEEVWRKKAADLQSKATNLEVKPRVDNITE